MADTKVSFKSRLIDFINRWRYVVALLFSILFGIVYIKGLVKSMRLSTADILTVSSIILGILGVFIGLLISMQSSLFFEKLKLFSTYSNHTTEENKFDAFKYLVSYLRNAFMKDVFFVAITVMIDFVPSGTNLYIKLPLIVFWTWLLLISLWEVFYSVDYIVKIALFEEPKSKRKTST
ncbi:hypothetical protein [Levilactobacillus brevis]|uniref:hypothetical protein n=1 Tax=Levilactobacillus brevis TaxID=1580 RepID=UPI003D1810A5